MTPQARPPKRVPDPPVRRPGPRRATGSRYGRRARQSTRALTAKLVLLSLIATLVIGGLLAAQMAAGSDPALAPKAVAQAKRTAGNKASNPSGTTTGGAGSDPYSHSYGDGSYYGYPSGGSGSSGYSGSSGSSGGSGGYSYSPPPVTSSTS